jgi:hypothetical protein
LARVAAHRVECRALVPALGAADAVVLVDLDDLAAHALGNLAQFALLVGRRLLDSANPQIENRPAWRKTNFRIWWLYKSLLSNKKFKRQLLR